MQGSMQKIPGIKRVNIWAGSQVGAQNVPMTQAYTDFDYLILTYGTNAETVCTIARVPLVRNLIFTSVSLFNGSGQQTDFSYKATSSVAFPTATTFNIVAGYNNPNLTLHLLYIDGIKFV